MRLIKEEYILADFIKKFSPSVTLSGAWRVSIHDGEFSNYLLLWLLLSCSFRHALQRQQNLGGRNKPWQHQHHAPWLNHASVPQFPHLWAWRIPANHGFGVRSPKGVYAARQEAVQAWWKWGISPQPSFPVPCTQALARMHVPRPRSRVVSVLFNMALLCNYFF